MHESDCLKIYRLKLFFTMAQLGHFTIFPHYVSAKSDPMIEDIYIYACYFNNKNAYFHIKSTSPCKHFLHYWPFVKGTHRWWVDSSSSGSQVHQYTFVWKLSTCSWSLPSDIVINIEHSFIHCFNLFHLYSNLARVNVDLYMTARIVYLS